MDRAPRPGLAPRVKAWPRRFAVACARPTSRFRLLPAFLIVGAQRSGTTSLFHHLMRHPGVLPPVLRRKGVHYFDTGFDNGWGWYRSHFPTVAYTRYVERRRHPLVVTGEASPYYMFHPLAPSRIAEALPDVKLVVLLRDPVDRAYSHYQHMLIEGHENAPTFERAIALEPERLAGEEERILDDPAYRSFHHQHHSYLARGLYANQLERLFVLFPRDRVLVRGSEQFFDDLEAGLPEVYDFLGLASTAVTIRKPRYNGGSYPPLATRTRDRLNGYYEESNRRLVELVGLDPDDWRAPR